MVLAFSVVSLLIDDHRINVECNSTDEIKQNICKRKLAMELVQCIEQNCDHAKFPGKGTRNIQQKFRKKIKCF